MDEDIGDRHANSDRDDDDDGRHPAADSREQGLRIDGLDIEQGKEQPV